MKHKDARPYVEFHLLEKYMFANLKLEVEQEMLALKTKFGLEVATLEARLKKLFTHVDTQMVAKVNEVKTEVKADVKKDI